MDSAAYFLYSKRCDRIVHRKGDRNMQEVDPKLLEMAEVFHIPKKARLKYIILPAKMPGLSRMFRKKNRADASDTAHGDQGGVSR